MPKISKKRLQMLLVMNSTVIPVQQLFDGELNIHE